MIGLGIDAVDVGRIASALKRTPAMADRLFTPGERAYCQGHRNMYERFAVRFAAKEAGMKALGVGIGAVGWHDFEVVSQASGAPLLVVTGRAESRASAAGGSTWMVSLTHTSTLAQAIVVLLA